MNRKRPSSKKLSACVICLFFKMRWIGK
jgi:hypothetical protein